MSATNPNSLVTEERLSEFYQGILPYLGGMPEALANKFNKSDLYSTDEKIVGCWIDGKPVYQKVLTSTTSTSSDIKFVSVGTGISVDKFISIDAMLYDGAGNIPFSGVNAAESSFGATLTGIRVTGLNNIDGVHPNTVGIKTNVSLWQGDPIIVIVKYTKTTDAANSFKYGSETDYSTDEKIVGTWIDGKPLYQKTIDCGALPNATSKEIAHGISNFDICATIFGIAKNPTSGGVIPLPLVQNDGNNAMDISLFCNQTNIYIVTTSDRSSVTKSYVTIQYTKAS